MIKIKKNILLIIFIISLEIIILLNSNILISSSLDALNLFINKLFISLFPFFILNKILLSLNLPYYISKLKINILSKIFKINKSSLSIIILSMLTGFPSNAEYIKDYLNNDIITIKEAEKLLIISFFPSPAFVVTTVGYLCFNSISIGFILLLIIYFSNFIIGLFIRNKYEVKEKEIILNNKNDIKIMSILKDSIISSINSSFIILGNIIIFSILLGLINKYLNLNIYFSSITSSLFELTNGIKKISSITTNFNIKFSLTVFALIFSGISIHSQISSILSEYNINFKKVFIYRLILAISFAFLIYVLFLL